MNIAIRPSRDDDVAKIAAIYRHHVLHGVASFEDLPPDEDEVARRRRNILALNLPYLVAESSGRVVGYCYASRYRARSAYRFPSKIRFISTRLKSVAASVEPCSRHSSSAAANSAIARWSP
jgi:hypothetical protein